jgi:hypothetical protein
LFFGFGFEKGYPGVKKQVKEELHNGNSTENGIEDQFPMDRWHGGEGKAAGGNRQ